MEIPNTLVHIAVQTTVLAPFRVPLTVIFAGCVIPDLPWIFRRLVAAIGIPLDPIAAYAYFIAQASSVGCIFACMALGAFFKNYKPVVAFAFLGCLVHLILDSLQDKWGNGVHLVAPLSWEIFSFGIFQLDSMFTYLLALTGLVPFLLLGRAKQDAKLLRLTPRRITVSTICIIAYIIGPVVFIGEVVASNSRYLDTLANNDVRGGKLLELDREVATITDDTTYVTTHTGEMLVIVNPYADITDGGTYSFRGVFKDEKRIRLIEWKPYSGMRDIASYIGLSAILCWISAVVFLNVKHNRT